MTVRRDDVTRPLIGSNAEAMVLGLGAGYLVLIVGLFVLDQGLAAVFMTMPAWVLVGGFQILLTEILPESILQATVLSGAGNLTGLLLSAALNVAVIYGLVRWFKRPSSRR